MAGLGAEPGRVVVGYSHVFVLSSFHQAGTWIVSPPERYPVPFHTLHSPPPLSMFPCMGTLF